MELAEKVLREVRMSARTQEELQNELINLKGQIAMEEQSLNIIKSVTSNNLLKQEGIEQSIKSLEGQLKFLEATRDANTKTVLRQLYLREYATKIDPNREEQARALAHLEEEHKRLISNFENNPDYIQVLEAEATSKQLSELINEKRNEYMRLEAAELGQ